MTQTEQVVEKLRELGGFASLGKLYETLDFSSWGTKTPEASVRRIVQNSDLCYKICPGLWGLTSMKSQLQKQFEPESEKFTHAYYQGMLCRLGKIKNFTTFIPAQDQNKQCLDVPLKQIADTTKLPEFAFLPILKRASTVDVIWFRKNQMPDSFYEVEHTTDIRNSLEKFCDLQDFYSRFYIIAPAYKKAKFSEILETPLFRSMQKRIEFFSYDALAKQYEVESALAYLPAKL